MNKVKAFIERGNDGTYGVYVDLNDNTLNYGVIGDGYTVQEAVEDFKVGYLEMKELYENEGKHFVEAEFEFHYDASSFRGIQRIDNRVRDFANNLSQVQFV